MTTKAMLFTPETATDVDEQFIHYYDLHPTKEDLMGESVPQTEAILYVMLVLRWMYHKQGWFIGSDLNIYRTRTRNEYPIAPDVAVFKGIVLPNLGDRKLRSWRLYESGRIPPQVVFEFASEETWKDDLATKPAKYQTLGAQEYFAYDPNDRPYFPVEYGRLRGWKLVNDRMTEQQPDERGWMWSTELESWLVPNGVQLQLYTTDGQRRLTEAEEQRRAAEEQRRAAEEQRRAAEEQRRAKEAAWAKLRELGIDPEKL